MRRVRYVVAASLDGYIAGPDGEADWITSDPDVDFAALFAQFDTFLIGRRTYDGMPKGPAAPGVRTYVFSRTLRQEDRPGVVVVSDDVERRVRAIRGEEGKDIWLFGGGELFGSLLEMGLVDTVEVAVIPVLLGGGIPLRPVPAPRCALQLTGHKVYGTGIVSLQYDVRRDAAKPGRKRR